MRAILLFDGGARPTNPGPAGCAWVILDLEGRELKADSAYLGEQSNNRAEYAGLIGGLVEAQKMGVDVLEVRSDSQLVIRQMRGEWRVRSSELRPMHERASMLATQFAAVRWRWNPRDDNSRADALCTAAIKKAVRALRGGESS